MPDDDRRDSRFPGRREEDAVVRELIRTLLHDEGYLTMSASDNRYVRKDAQSAGQAAGRDWSLRLIGLVLVAGQLVTTILVASGGNP